MNIEESLSDPAEPQKHLSMGGTEDLKSILQDLNAVSEDIQLSMVATIDGLTMATEGVVHDHNKVAAMCTELLTVCTRSAKELQQGDINEMFLRCSDSNILLIPAGTMAVLALMTKPDINLGLLLIEAERAAKTIGECL